VQPGTAMCILRERHNCQLVLRWPRPAGMTAGIGVFMNWAPRLMSYPGLDAGKACFV